MKKFRVYMIQTIHGKAYPFNLVVMASDENDAKKKASTTFSGYKAL